MLSRSASLASPISLRSHQSGGRRRHVVAAILALVLASSLAEPLAAAPAVSRKAPAAVSSQGPDRSRFTATDLARVSAVSGAALFVGSVVLYQFSQRALIRLDDRLAVRDDDGLITGIGVTKARDEMLWINNQRTAAAVTAGLGLAAIGFGVGVLVATPDAPRVAASGLRLAATDGGFWAGWELGW